MNLTEFETFIVQVEPDGFTCLTALAIESPQHINDLVRTVRICERKVKEIMQRLYRFGYAGPVAPLNLSKWNITTKAKSLLLWFFQNLIGHGSDPRQLSLLTGSNPDHITPAGSDPSSLEDVARRAQRALIHSDQIIDQSVFDPDNDHESEMNEPARDVRAVAAALDRNCIKDLPSKAGKPENNNRTKLLADAWVTAERIDAAIERAKVNPKRLSPSPIGLAVAELLKHRPEIDEWISDHGKVEVASIEEEDEEQSTETRQWWPEVSSESKEIWQAALGELELEMTRANYDTWVKSCDVYERNGSQWVIAAPNSYAVEWLENRLMSTVRRVLIGITGKSVEVKFVCMVELRGNHG